MARITRAVSIEADDQYLSALRDIADKANKTVGKLIREAVDAFLFTQNGTTGVQSDRTRYSITTESEES
jgi:predicted transcriptional regulator